MERIVREVSFCKNKCKTDVLYCCVAVVELAVALGREGKVWPGTVLCSSRAEVTQGKMERMGRRKRAHNVE